MFHVALSRLDWNGVGLASRKVAELVKSFEQVNEILDGFRYKMGAFPLNSTPFRFDCAVSPYRFS